MRHARTKVGDRGLSLIQSVLIFKITSFHAKRWYVETDRVDVEERGGIGSSDHPEILFFLHFLFARMNFLPSSHMIRQYPVSSSHAVSEIRLVLVLVFRAAGRAHASGVLIRSASFTSWCTRTPTHVSSSSGLSECTWFISMGVLLFFCWQQKIRCRIQAWNRADVLLIESLIVHQVMANALFIDFFPESQQYLHTVSVLCRSNFTLFAPLREPRMNKK